jgi:3-hydroxymyristoyl/3-hydroxydecanoyl-(acyl carrier protein) dehydratase
MALPGRALLMIDRIDCYLPRGGPAGLGFIRGVKTVDPDEWFFKAHFYQDPVWPGSLGIEAFYQLLKVVARDRWPRKGAHCRFSLLSGRAHRWSYRGQVTPDNRTVVVEASLTSVAEGPRPALRADGFLHVDGLPIYAFHDFGLRLVPVDSPQQTASTVDQ